ncbi:MAG: restriction endonuclease subunit S [Candidatus Nanoarchaeia archaeon]|nr:restriction endonuclease subunit S [Candidatus Nanoarchaeia archaeon]
MKRYKLNLKNWKYFNFNDIFSFERGKRLVELDQIGGDIPYIASSKKNNGITNTINPPEFMKLYRNVLTLNNSGSVGYCFYQESDIVCSDHVTVIWIKDENVKLNPYTALYLKPIIESMQYKFNFAREISDARLNKEKILLPTDKNGNPDWYFMENYIKHISKRIKYDKVINLRIAKKLDTQKWKWFDIGSLFEIKKGERLIEEERIRGEIPLITASSENNGVVDLISYPHFNKEKKCFENKITIDMFFNVFYHNYKYFSDDNVHTLIPLFEKVNTYISLFLVAVLKELQFKYAYGRQLRIKRLELEKIKLPIDKRGKPNWVYMEDYIKSLPYSSNL